MCVYLSKLNQLHHYFFKEIVLVIKKKIVCHSVPTVQSHKYVFKLIKKST